METLRRTLVPLSVLSGLAWITGILLVATQADTDPVGRHYEAANRALTPALILLTMCALTLRLRVKEAGVSGITPVTFLAAAMALMLAGNAIEFWGALVAGSPVEAMAERTATDDVWQGSFPGFLVFLAGDVLMVGASIALAVRMATWPGQSTSARIVVAAGGILMSLGSALWAVSPLAALVPSILFAFAWLTLAVVVTRLPAGEAARPGRGSREVQGAF